MALSFATNSPFKGAWDRSVWFYFFDDFMDEYALTSNLPVAASSPWVGTALSSGTFAMSTDAKGGVCVLSGAGTTDNSGAQIQQDMEVWSLEAGKEVWFTARLKASDATQSEVFVGLAITDTTLLDATGTLAAGMTHSDSVGFYKPDGETNWYGVVRRDSVQANTGAIGTSADDTYILLEARVVMDPTTAGKGRVTYFVNGAEVGRIDSTTLPYDSEEFLALSVAMNSGDNSGTKTVTVDFIGAAQQR